MQSLDCEAPDTALSTPLIALWGDANGDWERAHKLVNELESREGMAVHAYLHRKEGSNENVDYWYLRSGREFYCPAFEDEWRALVEGLLA